MKDRLGLARGGRGADEEGLFRVFDQLWRSFLQKTFGSRTFWFSRRLS
jgi:hypothetical protein